MPCAHNASCREDTSPQGFACSCLAGFGSSLCEHDRNECISDPCSNGAACVESNTTELHPAVVFHGSVAFDAFYCHCIAGWNGTLCELNIQECDSRPCENDAACTDAIDAYNCICISGFEGHNCNGDIDECSSQPCQSAGKCSESTADMGIPADKYNCTCVQGFDGHNCEDDVDECTPDPCQNNATVRALPGRLSALSVP